jgi:hypothetical protein
MPTPVPRRRRTRSRRTTRRLHRTRRHRQRGGYGPEEGTPRQDLSEWVRIAKEKAGTIDTEGDLSYSIPEKLKDERLTLTLKTAPALPPPSSASEISGVTFTAETLIAAAARMVVGLGDGTFSSPQVFKDTIGNLQQEGPNKEDTAPLLNFMRKLEQRLRGDPEQMIELTNVEIYPLYIWFAVANYDRALTEDALVPFLGPVADPEPTVPTPAPAPIEE